MNIMMKHRDEEGEDKLKPVLNLKSFNAIEI